jgi:hypothetical protein
MRVVIFILNVRNKGRKIFMKNYLEKSIGFEEYRRLIDELVAAGKTSGPAQSAELAAFTKLNQHRMDRLEKTIKLNQSLVKIVRNLKVNWIWLILTEAWCGDAAQNIPPIEKIARENDGIETRYVLRDENLELMDKYLTRGARAIPKLICLDAETLEEIGVWGSRPAAADRLFQKLKTEGMEKPAIIEKIIRWYNDDNTEALQAEFEELVQTWANK